MPDDASTISAPGGLRPSRILPVGGAWRGTRAWMLAAIAVGLAAALPWVGFVSPSVPAGIGLDPVGCDTGDLGCAAGQPSWLATVAAIAAAGAAYGVAAQHRTGRGSRVIAALAGGGLLIAGVLGAYLAVGANPVVDAIHGLLGVGLDELTPWVGIAEAFGIATLATAFVVVLGCALAARARMPVAVALLAALAAAAGFVAVVVVVDPIVGIRLGAETIGTRAMPWTGLIGNLVAGTLGGLVGLWRMRRNPA